VLHNLDLFPSPTVHSQNTNHQAATGLETPISSDDSFVIDSPSWRVVGVGDFNGNNTEDILVESILGEVGAWNMSGGLATGWLPMPGIYRGFAWSVIGCGDFNGNNTDDVLLKSNTGEVGFWDIANSAVTNWGVLPYIDPSSGWQVMDTGDFNGNGTDDVLLFNSSTGQVGAWSMSNGAVAGWIGLPSHTQSTGWRMSAVGDIDGNGYDDILFAKGSGQQGAWMMGASGYGGFQNLPYIAPSSGWRVVGSGDVNGNGTDDVVLSNINSGKNAFWNMGGGVAVGWTLLPKFVSIPLPDPEF
jgi:serralysin